MELVVPAFALGSLYYVNNKQNEKKKEGFKQRDLPNTNLPDKNYPNEERPKFLGRTALDDVYASSKLSNNNKYTNDGTFTDKYFTPNMNATKSTKNSDVTDNYQNTFKSLTGMDVNKDYFKHNNMVPFFGSKSREQVKEDSSDYLLDNYVGSGSQQITKKEQSSLFSPQENAQWAHGTPNANSFFKSRINPSNKRSNEKPFESEMVAPGLGNGSNGFNSGMMGRDTWLPKSVDELRTTSNMKAGGVSLMNREGPAMSKIVNRGEMGAFEQNRPSRIYENNPDRWFTTTGAEKGRTMRAEPIMRMVNRPETTTDYTGAAVSQVNGEYVPGEYMPSTNINLGPKPTGVPNAIGSNTPVSGEYGLNAKKAYPNNRTVNEQPNYFGNIGTSVTAAVSPLLDILRPSRKENAIGNLRPYQNPGTTVSQTYMFNPADRTKTTHRETMEESKQNFNINANQLGGAYRTTQHQVSYTTRNETGDFYYSGNAEGAKEMKSFEAEKNQRNNEIKSSTIAGRMNPGNMSLLNSDVNITQRNRDHLLKNSRELSGNGPSRAPTTENMGMLAGKDNSLYSNVQMDRTNKDLLHALKSNPYVTNYKNAL